MTRTSTLASVFAIAVFGAAAAGFVGCTGILGSFEVEDGPTPEGGTPGSKANGEACGVGSDCQSTFCTDGVCCEASCSGVCESCKLDGNKGKCLPVPDGTNPDNECKPEPLADAGVVTAPDADTPPPDGGDAGDAAIDAARPDAAGQINIPDGGLVPEEGKCTTGLCNGQRACKFPGKEVKCGTQFCNTSTVAAGLQCDGKGHCLLDLETCTSFVCENNECRVNCASSDDCQSTHFCDGADFKCKPKKGNGLSCTNPNECVTGFCVTEGVGPGVCCNSECDPAQIPGATCKQAGNVGKCKCSTNCGTGACRLFYKDADNDSFGDKTASVGLGTAVVGCDNASPPNGYSAEKTDCDDSDGNVRPNQTGYFGTANPKVGFDYNCDGALQKYYAEYPGSTCRFCPASADGKTCPPGNSTCSTANQQSRLTCAPYTNILCLPPTTCGPTCGFSKFVSNTAGFPNAINCGSFSTYYNCGACAAVGGGAPITTSSVQQLCH